MSSPQQRLHHPLRRLTNKIYADVPAAAKQRIWAGNAVEFFKLA